MILLKHEYAELRYMEKGFSQNEAHIKKHLADIILQNIVIKKVI